VESSDEMFKTVVSNLKSNNFDIAVASAAVADYAPDRKIDKKISTDEVKELALRLMATPKIVDKMKQIKPDIFLIAFKAECNVDDEELIKRAHEKLAAAEAELIVANDVCRKGVGIGENKNEVFIIDREREVIHVPPILKSKVAQEIFTAALSKLSKSC